jgi:hypothetical protein
MATLITGKQNPGAYLEVRPVDIAVDPHPRIEDINSRKCPPRIALVWDILIVNIGDKVCVIDIFPGEGACGCQRELDQKHEGENLVRVEIRHLNYFEITKNEMS